MNFTLGARNGVLCYRICVSYCICFCISEEVIFHCSNSECWTLWSDVFLHCVRSLRRRTHVSLSSLTSSGTDLFERSETWKARKKSQTYFFSLQTPDTEEVHFLEGMKILDLSFVLLVLTNKTLSLKYCVVLLFPLSSGLLTSPHLYISKQSFIREIPFSFSLPVQFNKCLLLLQTNNFIL